LKAQVRSGKAVYLVHHRIVDDLYTKHMAPPRGMVPSDAETAWNLEARIKDTRNWQAATCKTVLRAVIAVRTVVAGDDPNANVLLNTTPAERRPLWIKFVHVTPTQVMKAFYAGPAHILTLDQTFYGMAVPTVQDKQILKV
jgi:hypothetical protein